MHNANISKAGSRRRFEDSFYKAENQVRRIDDRFFELRDMEIIARLRRQAALVSGFSTKR